MSEAASNHQSQPRLLAWPVAGIAFAACGALIGELHKGHWGVSAWISSNYLANYEDEFLKRALWGEIFTRLLPNPSQRWIDFAGTLVLALSVIATAYYLGASFRRIEANGTVITPRIARRWFWAIAACPAFFLQFGYDLGPLDQINLVLFLISIWLARKPGIGLRILILPLSVLAILTHEAYVLIHLPVVLGIMIVEGARAGTSRRLEASAMLLTASLAAFCAMMWGSASPETHARIQEAMRDARFDSLDVRHSTTIWVYSLRDTMAQTFARYTVLKGMVYTALFLGFGAAATWAYLRVLRPLNPSSDPETAPGTASREISPAERFLRFSPFVPLGLTLIGFDVGRWVAWMIVNQVFVALYLIETNPNRRAREKALAALPIHLGAVALLGPLGVTNALPLWVWIVRSLVR